MKINLKLAVIALVGMTYTLPALAFVGTFSRACRFDTLPLKDTLASFFVYQGAPPGLGNMASRPATEQAFFWIHESLTADYFSVRYYLFAKSSLYATNRPDKGDPNKYNLLISYRTNWSVAQVKEAIRANPKFSPHYTGRNAPFYNARAGDPRIMVAWHLLNAPVQTPVPTSGYFKVRGNHWLYDPQSGSQIILANTESTTCNYSNFGLGLFDY